MMTALKVLRSKKIQIFIFALLFNTQEISKFELKYKIDIFS